MLCIINLETFNSKNTPVSIKVFARNAMLDNLDDNNIRQYFFDFSHKIITICDCKNLAVCLGRNTKTKHPICVFSLRLQRRMPLQ